MPTMLAQVQDWLLNKGLAREAALAGLAPDRVTLPWGAITLYRSRDHSARGGDAGEAVLMLHGAAADKSTWLRFARHLDCGLPLLVPDLPGHGDSVADPALGYGIAAQAGRVAELLGALHITRVHLIASSMGGAIALRLAATRPGLVASLILMGAVGVQAKESWLQQHIRETGRNPMIAIQNKEDYLAMLGVGMKAPPYLPGFVVAALARGYMARAAIHARITRDMEADLDQRAVLPALKAPALILWGREDQVSHPDNAILLNAALPGSKLAWLDGVGHAPMVEQPQQAAALCRAFLALQSPR